MKKVLAAHLNYGFADHIKWFKNSWDEPFPDLSPYLASRCKSDVRLLNLVKRYDALQLQRWSSVLVIPNYV